MKYEVYVDTRSLGSEWWLPEIIKVGESSDLSTAKEIADKFSEKFNVPAFVKEISYQLTYSTRNP